MAMGTIHIAGVKLPVSRLILGTMMLHQERMEHAIELLDAYAAAGGNAFDSAHIYGANTAKALGNWMQLRGNRDRLVVIGKGAHFDLNGPRMTKEAMVSDMEQSLERLQTDYVDIFMLHRDEPNTPVGYILESLQSLIDAGKTYAIGASNWTVARIAEANEYAARHGLTPFACNSPNLSLAKPNEPRWLGCVSAYAPDVAWHEQTQLPLLSWSSQAGGFFTGRFSPDKRDDPEAVRVYYNDDNWERYRRARQLAADKGCDANQIALAYVLGQNFPVCALIGPANPHEMESSIGGLDVSLTADEVRWLDLAN